MLQASHKQCQHNTTVDIFGSTPALINQCVNYAWIDLN